MAITRKASGYDNPADDVRAGDMAAALDTVLQLHGSSFVRPTPGDILLAPDGLQARSLKALVDEWRDLPERRTGTTNLDDLASFIALTNRFKDADSVIYAKRSETAPTFTTVFDEHRAGASTVDEAARWRKHRARFAPTPSEPWKAWKEIDGKAMTQTALVAFLEARILDIAEPPSEQDASASALIRTLGGRTTGAAGMLEIARGLKVRENSEVISVNNTATGEVEVAFRSKLTNDADQPLAIPSCFSVSAPLFEGGDPFRLWMRIQMKKVADSDGIQKIVWTMTRYRPDLIVQAGVEAMLSDIREQTGLTVLMGSAE